ncbi:hypothetical protein DFP73DRAFT_599639 [Morchella snyderi]|nr:hypothetical protein DFP73DRAFT_599639 [Morchella snyderi]
MESTIQNIFSVPTAVQDNKQGLWTCDICNHSIGEKYQQSHLAGKKHKAKAQKIEQQSSDENTSSVHGNPMELGSSKTGALAGEVITDPVKLSYLRMKQQVELYGDFAAKAITTNFKTPREKEDSARDIRAVYPETVLHCEELEGNRNSNSTTIDIPLAKISPLQLRKKPGLVIASLTDLDISSTPPTAASVSLKAARQIQDFKSLNYPADILSPGLSEHSAGNFKYGKDFLMQFENVCTEKPLNWDKKIYGLFGDGAPLTEGARTALRLPTLSCKTRGTRERSGASRSSPVPSLPQHMMTSQQRFELSRTRWRPETGTSVTHSGADVAQKGQEGSLMGSEPNMFRSSKRASRRSRKNGGKDIDGAEPEQGDIKNLASQTAGFGGFLENNSSEREITTIPDNPPYTAYIGNLSFDIVTQEISDLFWGCDIKMVKLVRDKLNYHPKCFGYVEFKTKKGLIAATELNGATVCGRNIRVSIANPPTTKADQHPAIGSWRKVASTNLESLVNQTQQQQRSGKNSNVLKDEQRRSSLASGETVGGGGGIDIWGENPSDEAFSDCDWES